MVENLGAGKFSSAERSVLLNPQAKNLDELYDPHHSCDLKQDTFRHQAELAQLLFGSSIVYISVCEPARQWIYDATQTVALCAFELFAKACDHQIGCNPTFAIADTLRNHPYEFLLEPQAIKGIRFVARTTLRDRADQPTGFLYIADFQPKNDFLQRDFQILDSLGMAISDAIESQRRSPDANAVQTIADDRFALVFDATLDGIWDWDVEKGTVYYSSRWQYIFGLNECELSDGLAHWLKRVHPDDISAVQEGIRQSLEGCTSRFRNEHRVSHGDGSWRWVAVRGMVQRDTDNVPIRMAGSVADITDERTSDSLTGLPNKLLFVDRTMQLIDRCKKYGLWHFAVLAVDIDHLCDINARFGHESGDLVLKTVANRLQETVQRTRVGEDSMVCRAEKDEYFILLDGIKNASQAYGVAERIHFALRQPIEHGQKRLEVTVRIGITMARPGLCAPEQLLTDSQKALSRAKTTSKASTIILTPSVKQRESSVMELEEGLLEALPLNQLTTYFQPQVNLDTGLVTGCEALVRWNHPKRGLLQPSEFILLSEEMGLISLIDSWVLKSACQQLARWRHEYELPDFTMSVNISGHTLSKRGLRIEVEDILAQHSIPPKALCLELTESVLLQENSTGMEMMKELREIGVGLHMDDFGIGYSSFKYLYELPFDALKIDSSFLCHFPADSKARNVIAGILALAKTMDLYVVAEGIEDAVQARTLQLMGCKVGQGFFFDRPLSENQFRNKHLSSASRHIAEEVTRLTKNQLDKKR